MSDGVPAPDWYRDGLEFSCTACGECCGGAPGFVWVSEPERRAIAARLGLTLDAFQRTFTRLVGDRVSLVERPDGDCVFLSESGRCEIHEDKPRQCVTYPFWPRLVASPEAWRAEGERCPGIGGPGARTFSRAEIDELSEITTPRERAVRIMRGPA